MGCFEGSPGNSQGLQVRTMNPHCFPPDSLANLGHKKGKGEGVYFNGRTLSLVLSLGNIDTLLRDRRTEMKTKQPQKVGHQ